MTKYRKIAYIIAALSLLLVVNSLMAMGGGHKESLRISTDELKKILGSPELVIVDVRDPISWSKSDSMILGAVREDPNNIDAWVKKYSKKKKIIFYCAWPYEKTSVRVARQLKKKGYEDVFALTGGWVAWQKANYAIENK